VRERYEGPWINLVNFWVDRGTWTPKDRDEVKRREV
jgi:hypothetical protein